METSLENAGKLSENLNLKVSWNYTQKLSGKKKKSYLERMEYEGTDTLKEFKKTKQDNKPGNKPCTK